jgi:hypothetical protein
MEIKPSILLHSCCGPCSTAVIERLLSDYSITVFYYNPNITDPDEYDRRKSAQKLFLEAYPATSPIRFIEGDYNPGLFLAQSKGYEREPEGGTRCGLCFTLRLRTTAEFAQKNGYAYFGTTLSVSPHKDADIINSIGLNLSAHYNVCYLSADFKKQDGYARSVQMAKAYQLYRQHYCGCRYSIPK